MSEFWILSHLVILDKRELFISDLFTEKANELMTTDEIDKAPSFMLDGTYRLHWRVKSKVYITCYHLISLLPYIINKRKLLRADRCIIDVSMDSKAIKESLLKETENISSYGKYRSTEDILLGSLKEIRLFGSSFYLCQDCVRLIERLTDL
eukprot:GHVP01048037.1.p1 GENE.GHVP01048037.1~~GHVP01048037.1.p1  ORF type:complete len:151 (+),score=15.41 GHVP01048037.1:376-828(+)